MLNTLAQLLLLIYVIAFVRQFLWLAPNNTLAWILTGVIAAAAWYYLRKESFNVEKFKSFWLIVALPLFVIYAMRVAFPDTCYDQLNYHLLSGERALRGVPFTSADFFPAALPFNPSPQMVTGIMRYALGYRLGTIVNFLAMIWAGALLYQFLRRYLTNEWFASLAVLLILLTEQPLFMINNYMVDVLSVPLLLEATFTILDTDKPLERRSSIRVAFLLGASVAFKLTNIAFAGPLILVYIYKAYFANRANSGKNPDLKSVFISVAVFIAPVLPFSVFMFAQTGSPLFPFYNKIFRSPFWPLMNWYDVRWGPKAIWETVIWPVIIWFQPERTTELPYYSGRLSLVFIVAVVGLLLRPSQKIRLLCLIILAGSLLWTVSTGYVRYAIYLEFLGVATFIALCFELGRYCRPALAFATVILAIQSFIAVGHVNKYEWSMRPTYFTNSPGFMNETENIFRDRSFLKYVPKREQKLFQDVDVWVESNFLTNGLETLLKKDAPIILVCFPYYFETQDGLDRFAKTFDAAADKKVYSLAHKRDLSPSLDMLSFRGLEMGKFTTVNVPFYSPNNPFEMVLIEIRPPGKGVRREFIKSTAATGPMAPGAFRAELTLGDGPNVMTASRRAVFYVTIKNTGDTAWPALGQADGGFATKLGNHWLNENGVMVVQDDARASLLFDLQPGQETEIPITVTAPPQPGTYTLEIDMLQELVNWFGPAGSKTLRLEILVTAP